MSLNKYMHPRNPFFENAPNFARLAERYPEFGKYLTSGDDDKKSAKLDFKNAQVLKALCCVLLKDVFKLDVDLPLNHLIPRVPQRINYALWIEDLLGRPEQAIGIDIGCGCSCIYGLIICSMNREWKMIVSDINEESISWAKKNVTGNNLADRITIHHVDEKGPLLTNLIELCDRNENDAMYKKPIDFVMCNPPFFRNESEFLGQSSEIRKPFKRPAAKSINTAQLTESVYEQDGEVGFIKRMIDESATLNNRIRIYTTMLGKKQSLAQLKKYLVQTKGISNISETQFCQGHTMRWGLAWTFQPSKLAQFSYHNAEKKQESKKSKPLIYQLDRNSFKPDEYNYDFLHLFFKNILTEKLRFKIESESTQNGQHKYELTVKEKSWTQQRAKRKLEKRIVNSEQATEPIVDERTHFQFSFEFSQTDDSFSLELNLVDSFEQDFNSVKCYLNAILQFIKNQIVFHQQSSNRNL